MGTPGGCRVRLKGAHGFNKVRPGSRPKGLLTCLTTVNAWTTRKQLLIRMFLDTSQFPLMTPWACPALSNKETCWQNDSEATKTCVTGCTVQELHITSCSSRSAEQPVWMKGGRYGEPFRISKLPWHEPCSASKQNFCLEPGNVW